MGDISHWAEEVMTVFVSCICSSNVLHLLRLGCCLSLRARIATLLPAACHDGTIIVHFKMVLHRLAASYITPQLLGGYAAALSLYVS